MNVITWLGRAVSRSRSCSPRSLLAQGYPAPVTGTWIARDFRFNTGEVMPELRLHYTTVGAASGEPVLILHGRPRVLGSGACAWSSATPWGVCRRGCGA